MIGSIPNLNDYIKISFLYMIALAYKQASICTMRQYTNISFPNPLDILKIQNVQSICYITKFHYIITKFKTFENISPHLAHLQHISCNPLPILIFSATFCIDHLCPWHLHTETFKRYIGSRSSITRLNLFWIHYMINLVSKNSDSGHCSFCLFVNLK